MRCEDSEELNSQLVFPYTETTPSDELLKILRDNIKLLQEASVKAAILDLSKRVSLIPTEEAKELYTILFDLGNGVPTLIPPRLDILEKLNQGASFHQLGIRDINEALEWAKKFGSKLEYADFTHLNIDNSQLQLFCTYCPKTQVIILRSLKLSGNALECLSGLENIKRCDISGCPSIKESRPDYLPKGVEFINSPRLISS